MSKPAPGRCEKCGCAMVRPDVGDVEREFARWGSKERNEAWVNGHWYLWDVQGRFWRLEAVRCDQHVVHPTDPRRAWTGMRCE